MFRSASHKGERGCSKETNYLDFGLIIRKDKIPPKTKFFKRMSKSIHKI